MSGRWGVPHALALIQAAPRKTRWRFIDFFTSSIRNANTRAAYQRAILQFLNWCEGVGVADLHQIKPIVIAAYIEQMEAYASKPTIKQHRSAISKMFDWLVAGNVGLDVNPASAVRIGGFIYCGVILVRPRVVEIVVSS